jgi:hypothetical protein
MKIPLRPGDTNTQMASLQRASMFSAQPQTLGASLQLVPGGHIKVGQSNYNVGTGFWLGLDEGVPKFSLGVSSGDNLTWDGDSLDITGNLTATTGTIGGFTLGSTTLTATNLILDSSGQRITLGSSNDIVILDADDATYRLWVGNATAASAPFSVTKAGVLSATGATVSGTLTASAGTIGGFTLGASTLSATNLILDSSGQRISLGSGTDIVIADADDASYRLWVGHGTAASAPFRVEKTGAVTCTNITISGGSVVTSVLSGLVALANQNIATQGWTQTSAFSVTDADTVAWGAGTFTAANGTSYSIGAGNTGNMAARTYIYLDIGVSTTAYQTTTTATTAVGAGKVLVATAINGTTEARFEVFGGVGGLNIDAANIVAGTITANEIAASTITAGKLSISSLSAIAADLGTITAGTITIDTSGYIRGGATDFNTGDGFFLGYSGAAHKFSVGYSSVGAIGDGKGRISFDGTSLSLDGELTTSSFLAIGAFTQTGQTRIRSGDVINIESNDGSNINLHSGNDIVFTFVNSGDKFTISGPAQITNGYVFTSTGGNEDVWRKIQNVNGSNQYAFGIDFSDSNKFKITYSATSATPSAGTECLAITTGGVVSLPTGQLQFPATQNASANANTLDDYEEGTWTPTITASSGTITTASGSGRYTKIGRQISCQCEVTVTTNGTGAGQLLVSVPITNGGTTAIGIGRNSAGNSLTAHLPASGGIATVATYDFLYPVSSGVTLQFTLVYSV